MGDSVSSSVGVTTGLVVTVGGDSVASTGVDGVVMAGCEVTTTVTIKGGDVGADFCPQLTPPKLNPVTARNARTNFI